MNIEPKIPMCIAVQLENGCGKYSRRAWLPLPATKKQFKKAVKSLDPHCCGVAINHYAVKVPAISRWIFAETPLAEVNHLASRLATLDDEQIIKLCAVSESEMYFTTVKQYIEFTYETDMFTLTPGIFTEEELGRHELEKLDMPESVKKSIDPHTFGFNIAAACESEFTSFGYLMKNAGYSGNKIEIPASLDLKGSFGEDLYGEPDYVPEGFENVGVACP